MTLLSAPEETTTAGRPTPGRLRVILMLEVYDGAQDRFLEAYELLRYQVSAVPGHISDQLCQSIDDPSRWLITSEWESAEPFLAWVDSPAHREMVKPMHGCVRDNRSLRYTVLRETHGTTATDTDAPPLRPGEHHPAVPGTPRPGPDGVVRHALSFTVKPGSEARAAELLAGYRSPQARVDDTTRLLRTSLFIRGNRIVRCVEVAGDLVAALRHVARQPEVRAVEEAINPYLEEDRDLDDPLSARDFFQRAALPAVHHHAALKTGQAGRHAYLYPVRPGAGAALAELLAEEDEHAAADPGGPLVRATVYRSGDLVVRLVDLLGDPADDPATALGLSGPRAAAVLGKLSEPAERTFDGLRRLLDACATTPVTDRTSAED
ncbi:MULTISPECIES: SchA/CurD-like domain-containing protein [Kitasatospora]|uniref:Putative WhiE I homolog n=1 Tax=Kitasatospora setae (strain ATCC 33774 / DSM 43861 / JCM 3304 / KCC A-0304 / NBRC 14216 / KM-6054) TaxID=452652 RepID=E4NJ49_KITSK|nr:MULTISPECIES: SchA/CurD-like domain-containing protein [Kitasatospora]BAJ32997.1 putative WhiE I homolog [Kitasatospora setae KM-6054]